jgi:hypothetical protein
MYVPGRFSDWRDALADVCGGTVGGLGYLCALRWLTRGTGIEPAGWEKVDIVDKG